MSATLTHAHCAMGPAKVNASKVVSPTTPRPAFGGVIRTPKFVSASRARLHAESPSTSTVSAEPETVTESAVPEGEEQGAPEEGCIVSPEGEEHHLENEFGAPAAVVEDPPENLRNIVFVSSEVAPWSKTGGLADVVGSLPKALASRGHRVMVISPYYKEYEGAEDTDLSIMVGDGVHCGVFEKTVDGCHFVFVSHPSFPRPGGIYSDKDGVYGDNQFRYKTLCQVAMEVPLQLGLGKDNTPFGDECVFVANDWHAALVPVYMAANYRNNGVYTNARSVLAVHNLKHQGVFGPSTYDSLNLPGEWYDTLDWQYPPHERQGAYEEEGHCVNHLKAGLITADRVVTVSPSYAEEIQTSDGGWRMEYILGQRSFVMDGVVNGIDMDEWNPASDAALAVNYTSEDFIEGKRANKIALQKELGLPEDPDKIMMCFIGRLDEQKGADILLQAAPEILARGVQLVCLGSGTSDLEDGLRWLENEYNQQARCWVGFNVDMAHKMTAAADVLLMPSRFEPCGLNQLYALRYGTIPVAHATGGLKDTVTPFNPETGSGTGFPYNDCDVEGLIWAATQSMESYWHNHAGFRALQKQNMEVDVSWNGAAKRYEQIFEWAMMDAPHCQ